MSCKPCALKSTIGTKVLMAITGLLLIGFLTTHLAGNFLLFVSADAFNGYAHALTSNPLIYVAEVGLLALFLIHIKSAIKLTLLSKSARPDSYEVHNSRGRSTASSRFMVHTGGLILVFLILHLVTFKFGEEIYFPAVEGEKAVRDLYTTVLNCFANKAYSAFYIFAMIMMGMHLRHGFQSAFQSLGINHPRYTPMIQKASIAVGVLFAIGYSIFPAYFGFINPIEIAEAVVEVAK